MVYDKYQIKLKQVRSGHFMRTLLLPIKYAQLNCKCRSDIPLHHYFENR